VSGGFHGPFVRAIHGSASEDAAKAPEPLGPSRKSSFPVAGLMLVGMTGSRARQDLRRDREASLFVFGNPLPIVFRPHMPVEACHDAPLPNVWPRVED
jgi:hypothetical protein